MKPFTAARIAGLMVAAFASTIRNLSVLLDLMPLS